ncbi:MAG: hypothetical protein NTW65_00585 [Deltaproteobacteria bacterium]|nr:hypothetical protein [Deltaproteobacteria bacterium]
MKNVSKLKNDSEINNLTKKKIRKKAIELRNQGLLYDVQNEKRP